MSRSPRYKIRVVCGDHKYSSPMIESLIREMMVSGKRQTAEKIVYGALESAAGKVGKGDEVSAFFEAVMKNVMPFIEVKPKRVGGVTYQVPASIPEARKFRRGLLFLKIATKKKRKKSSKNTMHLLGDEMLDAFRNHGAAVKMREECHKMADANKAYSHYNK